MIDDPHRFSQEEGAYNSIVEMLTEKTWELLGGHWSTDLLFYDLGILCSMYDSYLSLNRAQQLVQQSNLAF